MEGTVAARLQELFRTARTPEGKRWTLAGVAQRTGISASYLWKLRSGRTNNPTRDVLERLAACFDTSVSFFLSEPAPATGDDRFSGVGKSEAEMLLAAAMRQLEGRDYVAAQSTAEEALAKAKELGHPGLIGRAEVALARTLLNLGAIPEARHHTEQALGHLEGPMAGEPWVRATLLMAHLDWAEERLPSAYLYARSALELSESTHVQLTTYLQALFYTGMVARYLGRLDEAISVLERAREAATDVVDLVVPPVMVNLGLSLLDRGEPEQALRCFEDALARYVQLKLPQGVNSAQHDIGLAYAQMGRWDEAIECLMKSLGSSEALSDFRLAALGHMELAWCHANRGDETSALRHANTALALAQEHEWPVEHAYAHWHYAQSLVVLGKPAQARGHFGASIEKFRGLGLRTELAKVLMEYGDVLTRLGLTDEAATTFREAASVALSAPAPIPQRYAQAPLDGRPGAPVS